MSLFQEGYNLYYRQMVAQLHINKDMSFIVVSIILSTLLECDAMQSGKNELTYKKLTFPPS